MHTSQIASSSFLSIQFFQLLLSWECAARGTQRLTAPFDANTLQKVPWAKLPCRLGEIQRYKGTFESSQVDQNSLKQGRNLQESSQSAEDDLEIRRRWEGRWMFYQEFGCGCGFWGLQRPSVALTWPLLTLCVELFRGGAWQPAYLNLCSLSLQEASFGLFPFLVDGLHGM